MFLSLALTLLCQEPALRWSRDVDELFWQALHLLEVEERADDAVVTLAGLIDEPSVQQYRGQTGYVLAQQYRALRAGGRHEEAAALLPTIRRDVANTPMAQASEAVIELADRVHAPQDSVDQELVEMLVEATLRSKYLSSLATGYGEQIVPELLEIFDNIDHYFSDSAGSSRWGRVQALWQTAFMLNSSKLLEAMAQRVERRGADQMERFPVRTLSIGPEIGDAQLAYLIRLSRHEEVAVASEAIERLSMFAASEPSAHDRCLEVLRNEPRLAPFVLQRIYGRSSQDSLRTLYLAALDSEHEVVTRTARSFALSAAEYYSLYHLAVEKSDQDAIRFLLGFFVGSSFREPLQREPEQVGTRYFSGEVTGVERRGDIPFQVREDLDWEGWLARTLSEMDTRARESVFIGALERNDLELACRILEEFGSPQDLPWFLTAQDLKEPRLAQALEEHALATTELARHFELLRNGDRYQVSMPVVEHLVDHFDPSCAEEFIRREPSASPAPIEWTDRCLQLAQIQGNTDAARLKLIERYARICAFRGATVAEVDAAVEVLSEVQAWSGQGVESSAITSVLFAAERALINGADPGQIQSILARVVAPLRKYTEASALAEGREVANLRHLQRLLQMSDQLAEVPSLVMRDLATRPDFVVELFNHNSSESNSVIADLSAELAFWQLSLERAEGVQLWRMPRGVQAMSPETLRYVLAEGPVGLIEAVWNSMEQFQEERADNLNAILGEFSNRDIQNPKIAVIVLRFMLQQGLDEQEWINQARQVAAMELPWHVRKALVQLIGNRYTPELVSVLLDAQTDASGSVAGAADTALERYARIRDARQSWQAWERQGRDGSPIDALLEKTDAERPTRVRLAAIQSLGAMQAKEALPFLVELLEDADAQVVDAAQAAIDAIIASSRGDDEE